MVNIFQKFMRLLALFRLRPFETATEGGRSKERFRRAALTTVSSGGARAIGMMVSLVTVPLTFSYLGTERYGLWMVLISIVMSVMGFADLGIGNGLINAISEAYGKDDRPLAKQYVTSAFVMMLGIAAILTVVGAAGYRYVPWLRLFNVNSPAIATEGSKAFLVLFAWFLVSTPLGVVTHAQAALQQGYFPQIVGAFGSILTVLVLLVVIALHGGLPWLVFASTIGSVVGTALNGWVLFRAHPWLVPSRHAYSATSARRILNLGLLFFVLQCAVAVGYTSDNLVIAQVLGAAAVAAFAVPEKLFSFVAIVVGMAIGPLWPAYGEAIARGDVAWVRRVFLGSLRATLAFSVPLCTLLVLAGPWILRVAVGKSFHAPKSLLVALGVWGVVVAVSVPMAMLLNGAGVLKAQAVVAVVASLVNLALSIILTRRMGVIGVCLGSIITQITISLPLYSWIIRDMFKKIAETTMGNEFSPAPVSIPGS